MYEDEDVKGSDRDAFIKGRYDIGAIDYRGHFDCSYSAWFVRPVGYADGHTPGQYSPTITVKDEPM